jgi:hypothetical protein
LQIAAPYNLLIGVPDAKTSPKGMGYFQCSIAIVQEQTGIVSYAMHGIKMLKSVHRMKTLEAQGMEMNHCLMLIQAYNRVYKKRNINLNKTYVNCLYLNHLNMITA